MAKPKFKFSEFVDLLIVKLYEAEREQDSSAFVNLDMLAQQINDDIPSDWVFDAAKVLETRALANCTFNSMGTFAKISGEGRLYVEEGRGITKEVQRAPSNYYVTVNGDQNNVVTAQDASNIQQKTVSEDQTPIGKVLDEITKRIEADIALPEAIRKEALDYANLIRKETKKPEPNRSLVAAVLEPLSKIASIAGNVATLIKFLNASF
jgi:uncharacterized protein (UPF0147 family)